MPKKYLCPECFHQTENEVYFNDAYKGGAVCHHCGADLSKYRVKYGRDHSNRLTVDQFVDGLIERILKKESNEKLAKYIDQEFLWGAWGHVMGALEMGDFLLVKDLRGMMIAACKRSLDLNKRSE